MFIVINEKDECPTMDEKGEEFESFKTYRAALNKAKKVADAQPGERFHICSTLTIVRYPVGDAEITPIRKP